MEKVLVISLRFNPGHYSHLIATYKMVRDAGFDPVLFVHPEFRRMDANGEYKAIYSSTELRHLGAIRTAVFWFPSVKNVLEALRLKYAYKACLVYIYHEPFESISQYMASGFGFFKVLKILLVNIVSLLTVALSDRVVLPSNKATEIYRRKYRWLNRDFVKVPLIFDDEASEADLSVTKSTFSYIGTVAVDHAFDKYVSFVEAAIQGNWLPQYRFAIGTRSVIPEAQMKQLRPLLKSGRLAITEGKPLNTEEINHFYRESVIVWNAYNRSMQSGVLPKAFMFGAAVISSQAIASEYVKHEVTGMVVRSNSDVLEIKRAAEVITTKPQEFARSCRHKFETTFYYKHSAAKTAYLN